MADEGLALQSINCRASQAVFAFTNAKTPKILDSRTCSTLNLIRETAQDFHGLWLILTPMRGPLL